MDTTVIPAPKITPEIAPETPETFKNYTFQYDYSDLEPVYDYPHKLLTPNIGKINFVITHGHCSDGFMSATIARMYLEKAGVDLDTVTFYDAYYGADFSK